MSDFTPELAPDIVAACEANASDIAGALLRGIDAEVTAQVGEAGTFDAASAPEGFNGPGLAIRMQFGDTCAAVLLPESSKLVPDWAREPDLSGEGKLNTLAQEFTMLLVPESLLADQFATAWVENLSQALTDAAPASDAALVPINLTAGRRGVAANHRVALHSAPRNYCPSHSSLNRSPIHPNLCGGEQSESAGSQSPIQRPTRLEELPAYARHLLRIEVPVTVSMVSKKVSIDEVLELGPGAMISFDKSCDSPLELTVGDQRIALGSAVKVGENFGLEISEMTLPDEHFLAAKRAS